MRSGFSTLAVSAMNQTPQNAITSPSKLAGLAGQFQAVADGIGEFLDLGLLVVMRQDNGAAFALELEDFFSQCMRLPTWNLMPLYQWLAGLGG